MNDKTRLYLLMLCYVAVIMMGIKKSSF